MHTRWQNLVSDSQDHEELFRELYLDLKSQARGRMARENPSNTLNATALVHEAWLRLQQSGPERWRDRSQFFAAASEAMRRILVDAARRRNAAKRGGGVADVPLDGLELPDDVDHQQLLEVNEVLENLEKVEPVRAQIVKMRFYCGMENEEIAAILEVSEKTVRRHWLAAKVWLYRAIEGDS